MARTLNGTTDKIVKNSGGLVTALPITFACWFKAANATAAGTLMGHGNISTDLPFYVLQVRGETAGDPILATHRSNAGVQGNAFSSSGYTAGQWHHACAVFTSGSSRTVYLDGGGSVTDTTVIGLTDVDRTSIGYLERLTPGVFFAGEIMEVGLWRVALTAAEVNSLSKGFSPLCVRPQSLLAYLPLFGNDSTENSLGPTSEMFALTGTAHARHGRIIYPG